MVLRVAIGVPFRYGKALWLREGRAVYGQLQSFIDCPLLWLRCVNRADVVYGSPGHVSTKVRTTSFRVLRQAKRLLGLIILANHLVPAEMCRLRALLGLSVLSVRKDLLVTICQYTRGALRALRIHTI